ncbi:MAG: acyl-CoA dehydrogenase family protein [Gammaproteobacteria bacterium]
MLFEHLLDPPGRAFLDEVRDFLADHLSEDIIAAEDAQRSMVADLKRAEQWIDIIRPKRWHVGNWPKEAGGAGLSPIQNYLLLYEFGLQGAPHLPAQGLSYVGPTMVEFGTETQIAEILPGIIDGRDIWCQGFSEPGAGSDLASVKTFAERRGDAYLINGSKIWTTDAHHANKIFCLVRTKQEQSYDAISFLLIDMATPGVSVRPIRLMTGDHDLNQVFFDDVEVPVENLVGEEGGGWAVARYLLEIERGAFVFGGRLRRRFERTRNQIQATGRKDAAIDAEIDALDRDLLAYETTELRLGHMAPSRSTAMAEASIIKIEWTELLQRIDALAVAGSGRESLYADTETLGAGTRHEGIPMTDQLSSYFNNLAATIYAGSNEVQRNLVYRALRKGRS